MINIEKERETARERGGGERDRGGESREKYGIHMNRYESEHCCCSPLVTPATQTNVYANPGWQPLLNKSYECSHTDRIYTRIYIYTCVCRQWSPGLEGVNAQQ